MLSNSYVTDVYYKNHIDDEEMSVESWFVKVSIKSIRYWVPQITLLIQFYSKLLN